MQEAANDEAAARPRRRRRTRQEMIEAAKPRTPASSRIAAETPAAE